MKYKIILLNYLQFELTLLLFTSGFRWEKSICSLPGNNVSLFTDTTGTGEIICGGFGTPIEGTVPRSRYVTDFPVAVEILLFAKCLEHRRTVDTSSPSKHPQAFIHCWRIIGSFGNL